MGPSREEDGASRRKRGVCARGQPLLREKEAGAGVADADRKTAASAGKLQVPAPELYVSVIQTEVALIQATGSVTRTKVFLPKLEFCEAKPAGSTAKAYAGAITGELAGRLLRTDSPAMAGRLSRQPPLQRTCPRAQLQYCAVDECQGDRHAKSRRAGSAGKRGA